MDSYQFGTFVGEGGLRKSPMLPSRTATYQVILIKIKVIWKWQNGGITR